MAAYDLIKLPRLIERPPDGGKLQRGTAILIRLNFG